MYYLKTYFKEVNLSTKERLQLVNLTDAISSFVRKSKIESGICLVNSFHTTTGIIVNENESGLKSDILRKIQKEFPKGEHWKHNQIDDNAHAHLSSIFLGHSKTFPIKDGKLEMGTWQTIFFVELDGPRNRRILLEIIGE